MLSTSGSQWPYFGQGTFRPLGSEHRWYFSPITLLNERALRGFSLEGERRGGLRRGVKTIRVGGARPETGGSEISARALGRRAASSLCMFWTYFGHERSLNAMGTSPAWFETSQASHHDLPRLSAPGGWVHCSEPGLQVGGLLVGRPRLEGPLHSCDVTVRDGSP